jgi:hypothetical protein
LIRGGRVFGAFTHGIFSAGKLGVVVFVSCDLHSGVQIFHEADLADPIDESLATKDATKKLGWIDEALAGLSALLSILVIGCP